MRMHTLQISDSSENFTLRFSFHDKVLSRDSIHVQIHLQRTTQIGATVCRSSHRKGIKKRFNRNRTDRPKEVYGTDISLLSNTKALPGKNKLSQLVPETTTTSYAFAEDFETPPLSQSVKGKQ